ncbi:MAG: hypothetical protein GWN16_00110 [Calditrichae bacterium]|nr:hypothetical protein [Calditrichia bacterium]NIW77941.1 hypothetical protein [Calditrichia bacterium]
MILAAHQPNFMPWIGYFHKMSRADKFVLADDVQYTTQSFINRTRIKTAHEKQWLTVPVLTKKQGCQKINEVRIDTSRNWQKKHWKTLVVNYSSAPYFDQYADFFEQIYQQEWQFLVDLNVALIDFLRQELAITTSLFPSSQIALDLTSSTERIIGLAKELGCDEYLSGSGGSQDYLDEKQFQEAGICLKYNQFQHPVYTQQFGNCVSGLSVIDLLFNQGAEVGQYYINPSHVVLESLDWQL